METSSGRRVPNSEDSRIKVEGEFRRMVHKRKEFNRGQPRSLCCINSVGYELEYIFISLWHPGALQNIDV